MTQEKALRLLGKIAESREAIDNDPHTTAYVALSDACRHLGMLDEALSAAWRGVEVHPSFAPGYLALGRAQVEYGDLDEAERSFRQGLECDPDSAGLLRQLSRLCLLRGDRGQACDLLARAVELDPEDIVLVNLHKSLQPVPAPSAEAETEACSEAGEEPLFATATVADLYIRQGYPDKARRIYLDLLQRQPEDQSLLERLAQVESLLADQAAVSELEPEGETDGGAVQGSRSDVVATLQKWLRAIQVRREYVQKHSAGHC